MSEQDEPTVVLVDGGVEVAGRHFDVRRAAGVETRVELPSLKAHLWLFGASILAVPVAMVMLPPVAAGLSWLVGVPMVLAALALFRLMTLDERHAVILRVNGGERRIYVSASAVQSARVAALVQTALPSPQSPGVTR